MSGVKRLAIRRRLLTELEEVCADWGKEAFLRHTWPWLATLKLDQIEKQGLKIINHAADTATSEASLDMNFRCAPLQAYQEVTPPYQAVLYTLGDVGLKAGDILYHFTGEEHVKPLGFVGHKRMCFTTEGDDWMNAQSSDLNRQTDSRKYVHECKVVRPGDLLDEDVRALCISEEGSQTMTGAEIEEELRTGLVEILEGRRWFWQRCKGAIQVLKSELCYDPEPSYGHEKHKSA